MRPLVLYGEYELTLDEKHRMLVPSEIRRQIEPERDGEAFFLVFGTDGRLCMYPELLYGSLVEKTPTELTPDEEILAYYRVNLGMTHVAGWDKQGRILFPEKFLKRAKIDRDVTLLGVRDHLEVWPTPEWEAERAVLENRRGELSFKARQARRTSL